MDMKCGWCDKERLAGMPYCGLCHLPKRRKLIRKLEEELRELKTEKLIFEAENNYILNE